MVMSRQWKPIYWDSNYHATAIGQEASLVGRAKWDYFQTRKGVNSNAAQHNRAMRKARMKNRQTEAAITSLANDPAARAAREAFIARHSPSVCHAASQDSRAPTREPSIGSNPVAGLNSARPNVLMQRPSPSDLEESPFGPKRIIPGSRPEHTASNIC
jgi:hypothetical protein